MALANVCPAWALGSAFQVGVDGWTLETFGTDVAVLRAPVSSQRSAGEQVGVLLSCSGSDRRVRLSFPTPLVEMSQRARVGAALFTQTGRRDDRIMVASRFALTDASTLAVSAPAAGNGDVALTIGRILLTKPAGLDVILHFGTGPVAFTHLVTYRLFLSVGVVDGLSIGRFLDACHRAMANDAG